jgi:phage baseplate assembly protein W
MAVKDLKGISFPFRRGENGFPEPNAGTRTVIDRVKAALLTSRGELPMGNDIGTGIDNLIFESLTPILQAKIAQELRDTIGRIEPTMNVLAIDFAEDDMPGGASIVVASVQYEIADEDGSLSVPVGFTGGA